MANSVMKTLGTNLRQQLFRLSWRRWAWRRAWPAIARRPRKLEDAQLTELIHQGRTARGMPSFASITGSQLNDLIAFLHTLRSGAALRFRERQSRLPKARRWRAPCSAESLQDLALRTADDRIHLFRPEGHKYREVTSQVDWTSYNGDASGNRYSNLEQIKKANVARLTPNWMFTIPDAPFLETTPVVVEGIMYFTASNQCIAVDAGSGRELWHFRRDRTKGLGVQAARARNAVLPGREIVFSWRPTTRTCFL